MQRPMRNLLRGVGGRVSLHMPGAQGRAPFRRMNPYRLDTTELPVTDDLYRPSGAIAEAERLIARSAGAQSTLLLHGGSTAGIQAMMLYACKRGDAVVLPRNVHISCLNLCALAGLEPVFAPPSQTGEGYVYTAPEAYAEALDAHPDAVAALALHGDYYGLLGDLPGIARETHARGKLLLCDEAHGAYFNWREDVPNAGACGADLFVQSAHKTLPALTPGAWLHAMDGVDTERLRANLRMVQTSSPSFLLMLSLDEARAWMDQHGAHACARLAVEVERFHAQAAKLGFADGQTDAPPGTSFDRLRLVLCAPQGGAWLQQRLEARGLDVEMCDDRRIVCILSLMDGAKRLSRLLAALRSIAAEAVSATGAAAFQPSKTGENTAAQVLPAPLFPTVWPQRQIPLAEAAFAPSEPVRPAQAVGRVSAASVGRYPPGVAWLTPGDAITPEIAVMIRQTPPERLFGVDAQGRVRCVRCP